MNFREHFKRWRAHRNTVRELNRLSDRELHDIGIARSDIPFLVRQGR